VRAEELSHVVIAWLTNYVRDPAAFHKCNGNCRWSLFQVSDFFHTSSGKIPFV